MKKKSVSKILYIICVVVILLLIVGIVVKLFNNDNKSIIDNIGDLTNKDYTSFNVSYDNVTFSDTKNDYVFVVDEELRFNINYNYGLLATNKNYDYSVKIVPAEGTDFDFTVDGVLFGYSQETDLSGAFNLKKFDKYFSLTIPRSVLSVLENIYAAGAVVVPELDYSLDYYTLIVSSHDNKTLINISFKSGSIISAVVLDSSTLEF